MPTISVKKYMYVDVDIDLKVKCKCGEYLEAEGTGDEEIIVTPCAACTPTAPEDYRSWYEKYLIENHREHEITSQVN